VTQILVPHRFHGIDPDVVKWGKRVVTNGGALPGLNTYMAMSTLAVTLKKYGLWNAFYTLNCFAPDNLIACQTPLIATLGVDPWTNVGGNLVGGDLTINGLVGNGSNKLLDTGVTLGALLTASPVLGMTVYTSTANNNANEVEMGVDGVSLNDLVHIATSNGSSTVVGDIFRGANVVNCTSATALWKGYTSINRASTSDLKLFMASSGTAHNQASSNTTIPTSTGFADASVYVLGANWPTAGVPNEPTTKRVSYAAIHQPLNLNKSAVQFSAIQQMLTIKGGGFV
jgi:hypothetical protein